MQQYKITPDTFLSKDDTKIMKAIAICCMLMHHLWCFPTRLAGEPLKYFFTIFGISSTVYIGYFGKICVPLFFFLGGYGVYKSYFGRSYNVVEKLKNLYFAYWKVFLIFIPIGFIFFSNQEHYCAEPFIYTRFANFSSRELISNFLGFTSTYNREWWFLVSYAFALITFPLIRAVIDRYSARINIFIAVVVTILVTNIFPGIAKNQTLGVLATNQLYLKLFCQIAPYAASFWMGAVVARNGLLDRLHDAMKTSHLLNPIADMVAIVAIVFLRQTELGDKFDIFYIPVFTVVCLDLINRVRFVRKGSIILGRQSTNMWLLHTLFCYYIGVLSKIVTFPRYAILSLLTLIILTFITSHLVNYFWKGVGFVFDKVFCQFFGGMYYKLASKFAKPKDSTNPD